MNTRQFYIDGAWVNPIEGTELDVINPSTENVCAIISLGGKADADAAVAAAKRAFDTWSPTRMLVERSRYDEAVEQAKAQAEKTTVDLAQKSGTHIGPW